MTETWMQVAWGCYRQPGSAPSPMPRSADQHRVRIQRSDRVDPGLYPTLGVETTLCALHVFNVSFLVAG